MSSSPFTTRPSDNSVGGYTSTANSTIVNSDASQTPPWASGQSEDTETGAEVPDESRKVYSQAWYEGHEAKIATWVSRKVRELPLSGDMNLDQRKQMTEDICASIKSQWSSIMDDAGLTYEPYASEDNFRVLLDQKHPLHQARGQDISRVDVNCRLKFITQADKSEDGSTAKKSVELIKNIPVKCSITLPSFKTFKSATEQALTEFLKSDWLPSDHSDVTKAKMQDIVRQAVQAYSATDLSQLEDTFMNDKGLKDGDLAQVRAKFRIDNTASSLVANYEVRRLEDVDDEYEWQSLGSMDVPIAELTMPPSLSTVTTATPKAQPSKHRRLIAAGWVKQ